MMGSGHLASYPVQGCRASHYQCVTEQEGSDQREQSKVLRGWQLESQRDTGQRHAAVPGGPCH